MRISKSDYEESGLTSVHRKCFCPGWTPPALCVRCQFVSDGASAKYETALLTQAFRLVGIRDGLNDACA